MGYEHYQFLIDDTFQKCNIKKECNKYCVQMQYKWNELTYQLKGCADSEEGRFFPPFCFGSVFCGEGWFEEDRFTDDASF